MINTESFEFEGIYHIFSHVNGKEVIFREETNYHFFLKQLNRYILPIADIYAYCLLPNHFHLLLRFKSFNDIDTEDEHQYLMKNFGDFLNSYAKAYNKKYNRKGALFLNTIKRKKVNDEKYLLKVVHYVHNNPVHHGFVNNIENWKHSSYKSFFNLEKESKLDRKTILDYFDTINDFMVYHNSNVEYDYLDLE
ncbi:transposase [Chryseobacterium tructae]|uniref:transposase n=1 Tax=Chryseobacterium tructae TaxID=1037380 RepID=UPI0025B32EFE|nr:transposase [Chryseobacterium tructae]MDN3694959.1 transposase [Chryseobacterium tructae]